MKTILVNLVAIWLILLLFAIILILKLFEVVGRIVDYLMDVLGELMFKIGTWSDKYN